MKLLIRTAFLASLCLLTLSFFSSPVKAISDDWPPVISLYENTVDLTKGESMDVTIDAIIDVNNVKSLKVKVYNTKKVKLVKTKKTSFKLKGLKKGKSKVKVTLKLKNPQYGKTKYSWTLKAKVS